ncbi:hypothetical protein H6P81_000302 [Aristolochia fimbriata]|uniref:E2 ubiquitin-conjugating enzyme n=1 Tax=Aristolochia fimbriata TaxID=158543 RepID=A0AAV7F507_ARIFI|nr:hypothetical protein H6P81_000302 [Aristolochia fimbriata]
MAQAARLNLRMQRELKLLATDPPPGVSLPAVSEGGSDSLSLSAFDACILGPEGTVYEKGVFRIKIQIPERYPFQPPIMTFATPIYHPNIDNGGRICLDILNLPPKGAWQPSLNISTVLTSIGLLLMEPNPDDGLMCEASREYKYNRQLFDQKARSWTEKYARPGAVVTPNSDTVLESSEVKTDIAGSSSENKADEDAGGRKRLCGANRKLSVESKPSSVVQNSENRGNEGSVRRLSLSRSQNLLSTSARSSSLSKTIKADEEASSKDHVENEAPNENSKRDSDVPVIVIVSDSEGSEEETGRARFTDPGPEVTLLRVSRSLHRPILHCHPSTGLTHLRCPSTHHGDAFDKKRSLNHFNMSTSVGGMPITYNFEDANHGSDPKFEWGKKRGIGGAKKDVQFYESFTYDGIEYHLYDCVYLYKEGDPEPYIGKLVKIFGKKDEKKIKVVWFFRPIEILNWLGDIVPLQNEIFLAFGEGVGVYNLNPLEVLVGKCNVICTSKDMRNPQPSSEDLRMADFIFYRTFDVGTMSISEGIGNSIAGVEVRYFFNSVSDIMPVSLNKSPRENGKERVVGCSRSTDAGIQQVLNSDKAAETTPELKERVVGCGKFSDAGIQQVSKSDKAAETTLELKERVVRLGKFSDAGIQQVLNSDKVAETTPELKVDHKSITNKNNSNSRYEEFEKHRSGKDPGTQDSRPLKKMRFSETLSKTMKSQDGVDTNRGHGSVSGAVFRTSTDGAKLRPSISFNKEKALLKEKRARPSDGLVLGKGAQVDAKSASKPTEVTRRPDVDRSKWFKALPWEDRMQTAEHHGTLLFLQNLDPSYTSTDIEDLIWHALEASCTAKVARRTKFSSPHSGHAFVIFKSRDAAANALKRLTEACLLLPNGRPLVCTRVAARNPDMKPKFFGHLTIDSARRQQREETRNAVSTSHCAQPNTIEYEMAMEWKLLQAKSEVWWKELYREQGDELGKWKRILQKK